MRLRSLQSVRRVPQVGGVTSAGGSARSGEFVGGSAESGDALVDSVRWGRGEAQAEGVGEAAGGGEGRAGDERDTFGEGDLEQLPGVDAVLQSHPEEEAALG